jgi:maleylpyruvate isomerase
VFGVPAPFDAKQLDACVAGCAASHQLLLETVDALSETDFHEASSLPGWSRLTVVAHLALNAASFVHLLDEASRGVVGEQYPGGMAGRDAQIADAATWTPGQTVKNLRAAIYALEGAWAGASHDAWHGTGRRASGDVVAMYELPFYRWRETVVHLTDMNVGVDHERWPALYVRLELERQKMAWAASHPMGLTQLPKAALSLSPSHRLAWLLQRVDVEGLPKGPGL